MDHLRTAKIFKMLSQTNGMMSTSDSQNQKRHITVEKRLAAVAKNLFSTFLFISRLVIRPTVTFCRSLRTNGNANDEPLAKIALWRVTLYCLYRG